MEYTDVTFFDLSDVQDGDVSIVQLMKPKPTIKDSKRVYVCEEPAHPFYIRWINRLGGYDYFMFACNQKRTRMLTENDYYETNDAEGVFYSYNKAAKDIVETSSGLVDKETLEALAEMPLSPDIRLYKKDTQEWVPIQIESGDTEIMVSQPTGELLFSFVVSNH